MFLDEGSAHRLDDWWQSHQPREGERERVIEFLETLQDGSWRTRWYARRDVAGSPYAAQRWTVWLNDALVAIADLDYDGITGQVALTLVRVE